MLAALKRLHSATGTLALAVALLALVVAAAGAGYAAGLVTTKDIRDNAVTSAKIKKNAVTGPKIKKNAVTSITVANGAITPADLAPQEKLRRPALGNGGQGDCVWRPATAEVPGAGLPAYRMDRDGRVLLSGVAVATDGPGGDGDCSPGDPGEAADGIAFILPARYVPARTQFLNGPSTEMLIAGPQGAVLEGLAIPPGAVFGPGYVTLDSVEYEPVGSDVVLSRTQPKER